MQIGNYRVDILQQARMLVDGGWQNLATADANNKVQLGINQLLIRGNGLNMLVDTGIGNKIKPRKKTLLGIKTTSMRELLSNFDLSPEDITHVVLSHLHFDHSGGATRQDGEHIIPAFINAKYFIQANEWKQACNPDEISRAAYSLYDFLPLCESDHLQLINGDVEIAPGIRLEVTGGHTASHQMLIIEAVKQALYFPADICPTPLHLSPERRDIFDLFPVVTLSARKTLLRNALRKGSLIVFSHSINPSFYRITGSINDLKPEII